MGAKPNLDYEILSDIDLALLIARRDVEAVRLLTRRSNQLLFRTAWSILKNREDAEDVVQSTYLRGFGAIANFIGKSSLTTWLTRIAINEALGRLRAAKRRRSRLEDSSVMFLDDYREKLMRGSVCYSAPDVTIARKQIGEMLEEAIGKLPAALRIVFILRDVEGLSVSEVAEALEIPCATVKTRNLRARRKLQSDLAPELKSALSGTFPFAGADCESLTERIVQAHCGRPRNPGPSHNMQRPAC